MHSWGDMSQALQLVHGATFGSYLGISASGRALEPAMLFALLVIASLFAGSIITLPSFLQRRSYRLAGRNLAAGGLAIAAIASLSPQAGLNAGIFVAIAASWASLTIVIGLLGTQSETGFLNG